MIRSYKIAGKIIEINSLYPDIHDYCRDYVFDGIPDFHVSTSQDDISREQSELENFPESYLEELAVYRKIAEKMPEYNTFLFHGSALAVDENAFMFTAPSGTGKSTHSALWREFLGERVVMVNDDKPLINITGTQAVVYGTPFNGKHRLGNNIAVPLKSICLLERSEENYIDEISVAEAYTRLLAQTYRPSNPANLAKTLELLDTMIKHVKLYRLRCNMSIEAAKLCYERIAQK
ncbi:MAG: hypothetical protein IJU48_00875 [Synergistaceae bacterium]|nr:hypothetical protein [Synergistaceae bacterium]